MYVILFLEIPARCITQVQFDQLQRTAYSVQDHLCSPHLNRSIDPLLMLADPTSLIYNAAIGVCVCPGKNEEKVVFVICQTDH